jgi:hypothetical protein
MHIQSIHEYHREAFLYCMRGRPVIAMALMRMACELARDVFRIVEDRARARLWLDRSEAAQGLRRKTFRFDENDPLERMLKQAYQVFSEFGIHGHVDIPSNAAAVFEGNGQNFVAFRPDPVQLIKLIKMILTTTYYCLSAIQKYKTLIDQESASLQQANKAFALSYNDRAEPVSLYM